nr:uncharacterized protein I206_04768 [Kwoniella pini CBS 10737]OCF49081.1 hypothetical protein I206_04768 [Kwoniella pini CBS 10737]
MEAKLQKLKVTELKELLAKHHLVQTGKKDDLVKRLLDNNVTVDDEPAEELVDPDATTSTVASELTSAPIAQQTEASSSKSPAQAEPSTTTEELTPEQKAMKARAERFGIPFNPNPPPKTNKPKSTLATNGKAAAAPSSTKTEAPAKKEKAGAIDSTNLGISQDILDKRAAKFGIPEKKEQASAPSPVPAPVSTASAKATKPESKKKEEISP